MEKKIINYHNYDYFSNLDYKSKWEICSQLIHLFYDNKYFIIEREDDNDNDFEIYDSKKTKFNDCEPYFKHCNISFNIQQKYKKGYIYCISNDSCSNLIRAFNNVKLIDHEIYCGINQEKFYISIYIIILEIMYQIGKIGNIVLIFII